MPYDIPFTEFIFGETQPPRQDLALDCIKINVTRQLTRRKLYCYLFYGGDATAQTWLKARVDFYRDTTNVGSVPVSLGNGSVPLTGISSSLACVTSAVSVSTGSPPVADAITVYLANQGAGSTVYTVALLPTYVNGEIDEARLSFVEQSPIGVSQKYAFLALASSR